MGRVASMVEESTAFNSLYERRYNQFPQRNLLLHWHLRIVATTISKYIPVNDEQHHQQSCIIDTKQFIVWFHRPPGQRPR
mmetsp:Transcript_8005/g.8586  ORF Transcript_8005/g.8586 Transcript_8005/m.8586 type:complete len:80 (+) Transcript_8005:234-473(+)